MKTIIKHIRLALLAAIVLLLYPGCKKFVEVGTPTTQVVSSAAFQDDQTANAAVAGMYSYMSSLNGALGTFSGFQMALLPSISADEMTRPNRPTDPYLTNSVLPNETNDNSMWLNTYAVIYQANSIIEGLQHSTKITSALKNQLMGEALFIRAFCHFQLLNLFGAVPVVTTTQVNVSATLPRSSPEDVYKQIMGDLLQAQSLTLGDYTTYFAGERVRANKYVVTAFLARVYLYQGQWANAEAAATMVINNVGTYSLNQDLNTVFLENSQEAIWQLLSYGGDGHTLEGNLLTPFSPTQVPPYTLTSFLLNSFEPGDLRLNDWTKSSAVNGQTYYRAYKYKNRFGSSSNAEYYMVLRLAEQYLIRAEARAQQNNIGDATSGGLGDVNTLRHRAGLSPLLLTDKSTLLLAIEKERQTELFSEWGHRWFDLKRTGRADAVLGAEKSNWKSTDALYPIPAVEISKNPKLTQNPGY